MSYWLAENSPQASANDGPESLGDILPRVLRLRGIKASIRADDKQPEPPRTASAWNESGAASRISLRVLTPVA